MRNAVGLDLWCHQGSQLELCHPRVQTFLNIFGKFRYPKQIGAAIFGIAMFSSSCWFSPTLPPVIKGCFVRVSSQTTSGVELRCTSFSEFRKNIVLNPWKLFRILTFWIGQIFRSLLNSKCAARYQTIFVFNIALSYIRSSVDTRWPLSIIFYCVYR